jgi:hypothetical protein
VVTEVRKPRAESLKDVRILAEYLNDIQERTGGDTDLIDQALSDAAAAQAAAAAAQTDANLAQATANSAAILAQQGIDDAATAQTAADAAQATANSAWIHGEILDFASSTDDGRVTLVCPVEGTITGMSAVIGAATFGGGFTLTPSINGVSITGGAITFADLQLASTVVSVTPSALNTVSSGDVLRVQSGGSASTPGRANVLFRITRT